MSEATAITSDTITEEIFKGLMKGTKLSGSITTIDQLKKLYTMLSAIKPKALPLITTMSVLKKVKIAPVIFKFDKDTLDSTFRIGKLETGQEIAQIRRTNEYVKILEEGLSKQASSETATTTTEEGEPSSTIPKGKGKDKPEPEIAPIEDDSDSDDESGEDEGDDEGEGEDEDEDGDDDDDDEEPEKVKGKKTSTKPIVQSTSNSVRYVETTGGNTTVATIRQEKSAQQPRSQREIIGSIVTRIKNGNGNLSQQLKQNVVSQNIAVLSQLEIDILIDCLMESGTLMVPKNVSDGFSVAGFSKNAKDTRVKADKNAVKVRAILGLDDDDNIPFQELITYFWDIFAIKAGEMKNRWEDPEYRRTAHYMMSQNTALCGITVTEAAALVMKQLMLLVKLVNIATKDWSDDKKAKKWKETADGNPVGIFKKGAIVLASQKVTGYLDLLAYYDKTVSDCANALRGEGYGSVQLRDDGKSLSALNNWKNDNPSVNWAVIRRFTDKVKRTIYPEDKRSKGTKRPVTENRMWASTFGVTDIVDEIDKSEEPEAEPEEKKSQKKEKKAESKAESSKKKEKGKGKK
jgi:hypothetical protein